MLEYTPVWRFGALACGGNEEEGERRLDYYLETLLAVRACFELAMYDEFGGFGEARNGSRLGIIWDVDSSSGKMLAWIAQVVPVSVTLSV